MKYLFIGTVALYGCLISGTVFSMPPHGQIDGRVSESGDGAVTWPKNSAETWVQQAQPQHVSFAFPNALARLYYANGYAHIWRDPDAYSALVTQLTMVSLAGLGEEFEWRVTELDNLYASKRYLSYDLLATDSLLLLASYSEQLTEHGYNWLLGNAMIGELPEPSEAWLEQFVLSLDSRTLSLLVRSLVPDYFPYADTAMAIRQLQYLRDIRVPYYYSKGLVRPGDELKNPLPLIERLEAFGDLEPEDAAELKMLMTRTYKVEENGRYKVVRERAASAALGEDGTLIGGDVDDNSVYGSTLFSGWYNESVSLTYSDVLVEAVVQFQSRHGLKRDGVVGPNTRYWINRSVNDRIRLLALNAERQRLWPTERDRIVLVNIPNYEMQFWMDRELVLGSRVIVGRPSRKTPLFNSRVDSVIFNPHWNVPAKIMHRDILPKVKKNHGFLEENNFTVLDSWVGGEEIPMETIDWNEMDIRRFPYRLQQAPGDLNALGRYKFNTPNKMAIYLHDTPSKGLFDRYTRAFSSGCIRVEYAEQFADMLLRYSGMSVADYSYYQEVPETKAVALNKRISVYTIYQTAWVDNQGRRQFRRDIYQYDRPKPGVTPVTTRELLSARVQHEVPAEE
ncbi:L,D-transpeptidase family protein [Parasalinivibrio latis]|uniref:L,D-transpeptidase family protein n=1 Tax=Parasalinivibrio latis TaxID=2952610 RepID=UPI0030E5A407